MEDGSKKECADVRCNRLQIAAPKLSNATSLNTSSEGTTRLATDHLGRPRQDVHPRQIGGEQRCQNTQYNEVWEA